MRTYIAFLRGINVGGKNILPMKDLTAVLENIGLKAVRTYIQSGNVVFQSEKADKRGLSRAIQAAIGKNRDFEPAVLTLSRQDLRTAMDSNPFPGAEADPKSLHLFFMESVPANPDTRRLEALRTGAERYSLVNAVFYLHAPAGVGRSKLAANAERALGVAATARNWRTVTRMMSMADDLAGRTIS